MEVSNPEKTSKRPEEKKKRTFESLFDSINREITKNEQEERNIAEIIMDNHLKNMKKNKR